MKIQKRTVIWIFVSLFLVLLLFFSFKSYLSIKALLGNDVIIELSSDKENIFLNHNNAEIIKFNAEVYANPFCKIQCNSEFTDVSKSQLIEIDEFNLTSLKTISKEYTLTAIEKGSGQLLYRFDLKCNTRQTFWCKTNNEQKTRNILITLNYNLTEEENNIKEISKEELIYYIQELNYVNNNLNLFSNISQFDFNIKTSKEEIKSLNTSLFSFKILWENEEYLKLNKELNNLNFINFTSINSSFYSNVTLYNNLIETLTYIEKNLTSLKAINMSENNTIKVNNFINEFNNLINENNLNKKESSINSLLIKIKNLSLKESPSIYPNAAISNFNKTKIEITPVNKEFFNISFKEPSPKCPLFGKEYSCYNNKENYPIILLHGHEFNQGISAEYSLDAFTKIQDNLEKDNYLNAGSLRVSIYNESLKGIYENINSPLTIKSSYYFDIYTNTGSTSVIETKSDSIDTYAIRLRDIINIVKYKTGKDKVTIVAHSMGGLVARRYIQVFNANDIDKLILIGTPNHGIDNNIYKYCFVFGADVECTDMGKDSLFINKLNQQEIKNIPIYNIIGTGCLMDNEQGDGIVKNSSSYLSYAKNYYVNGTCSGLNFFHADLVDSDKYPEVYEIINQTLRE